MAPDTLQRLPLLRPGCSKDLGLPPNETYPLLSFNFGASLKVSWGGGGGTRQTSLTTEE